MLPSPLRLLGLGSVNGVTRQYGVTIRTRKADEQHVEIVFPAQFDEIALQSLDERLITANANASRSTLPVGIDSRLD